jgi:hypothetical protein
LSQLLGCSYQTILLWENNKIAISRTVDRLLRIIFLEHLSPENGRKIYDYNVGAPSSSQKMIFNKSPYKWHMVAQSL